MKRANDGEMAMKAKGVWAAIFGVVGAAGIAVAGASLSARRHRNARERDLRERSLVRVQQIAWQLLDEVPVGSTPTHAATFLRSHDWKFDCFHHTTERFSEWGEAERGGLAAEKLGCVIVAVVAGAPYEIEVVLLFSRLETLLCRVVHDTRDASQPRRTPTPDTQHLCFQPRVASVASESVC